MKSCFTRVVAIGALATALSGGVMSSSEALTLPVTPVQGIAGASPAEPVQWPGYGWGVAMAGVVTAGAGPTMAARSRPVRSPAACSGSQRLQPRAPTTAMAMDLATAMD